MHTHNYWELWMNLEKKWILRFIGKLSFGKYEDEKVRTQKSLQNIIHFSTHIYSSFSLYAINSTLWTSMKASLSVLLK